MTTLPYDPTSCVMMARITENYRLTFGKHKGQSLDHVRATDCQYLTWLNRQPWTLVKYPEVRAFIDAVNDDGYPPFDNLPYP